MSSQVSSGPPPGTQWEDDSPPGTPSGFDWGPASFHPPSAVTLPAPLSTHTKRPPVTCSFDARNYVSGGGVAIFHLATSRVVVCWHTGQHFWFLPKGRRDVGESAVPGAQREGYEESGYRNRVLPIPMRYAQPKPSTHTFTASTGALAEAARHDGPNLAPLADPAEYKPVPQADVILAAEPVLTQLMPVGRSRQYQLHWYVAETLPPAVERALNEATSALARIHGLDPKRVYVQPPPWPEGLGIRARVEMDRLAEESKNGGKSNDVERTVYEPIRHEGTGVDDDEAQYESYLVPVEKAIDLLDYGMDWVVRWGWNGIQHLWEKDRRDEKDAD